MRVAIIHDWLLTMRGGERCLESMLSLFDDVEIFTLFYEPAQVSQRIRSQVVRTGLLGKLPQVSSYYRYLLPLYPFDTQFLARALAKRHMQQPFDLIISISHCAAKNVKVPEGVSHVCYCLTPVRYLWDQYDRYFSGRAIEPIVRMLLAPLRRWDVDGAKHVDTFFGISEYICARIQRVYGRDSMVLYPPVRSDWIEICAESGRGQGFLLVNALVPYKNTHVVVEAFNALGLPLSIVGTGPEESTLRAMAANNISFLGNLPETELARLYRESRALVFGAEEDFGMTPVEMQAAGRPVICFAKGGSLETVNASAKKPTGVYFPELTKESVIAAVKEFIAREGEFSRENCRKQAERFSEERFLEGMRAFLGAELSQIVPPAPRQGVA